jgi:hypothetical protein
LVVLTTSSCFFSVKVSLVSASVMFTSGAICATFVRPAAADPGVPFGLNSVPPQNWPPPLSQIGWEDRGIRSSDRFVRPVADRAAGPPLALPVPFESGEIVPMILFRPGTGVAALAPTKPPTMLFGPT